MTQGHKTGYSCTWTLLDTQLTPQRPDPGTVEERTGSHISTLSILPVSTEIRFRKDPLGGWRFLTLFTRPVLRDFPKTKRIGSVRIRPSISRIFLMWNAKVEKRVNGSQTATSTNS